MSLESLGEWDTVNGVELCPVVQGPHFKENPLPIGKEQIHSVAVIRAKFGGSEWRRVCRSTKYHQDRTEVIDHWKNEYGVEVLVRA